MKRDELGGEKEEKEKIKIRIRIRFRFRFRILFSQSVIEISSKR